MEIDIIQIRCTEINNEIILYIDANVNLNTISSDDAIEFKWHYISVENKNFMARKYRQSEKNDGSRKVSGV